MDETKSGGRSLQTHIVILTILILIGCLWAAVNDAGVGYRGIYVLLATSVVGVELFTKRRWGTLSMIVLDVIMIITSIVAGIGIKWYETLLVIIWSACVMFIAFSIKQFILSSSEQLKCEHARYLSAVMIDSITELKTKRAYLSEASIYLRLARRNSLEVALFLWGFNDAAKMREKLGDHNFNMLIKKLSSLLRNHIRYEDLLFVMESDSYTWGMLMVTKKEFASLIAKRQREKLESIMVPGLEENWTKDMCVRVGVYDGGEDISPLTLYDRARKSEPINLDE